MKWIDKTITLTRYSLQIEGGFIMRKLTLIIISLYLISAFYTTTLASEKSNPSRIRQITGNVTAIDTKTNTIIVKKKDKVVALRVKEKTKIIQCIKKTSITDIKVGDKVTVKYKQFNGENTARSIIIREDNRR
jgi:Cu/Ag efflux protein CusF